MTDTDELMECQECGMWVHPGERHTIGDCIAFTDRESFPPDEPGAGLSHD